MYQPLPQLSFGTYTFPVTFQETSRTLTLAFDKKKIPFNWGEQIAPNTSMNGRTIEIGGAVGSMITGSLGNVLSSATDLEAERRLLAALQAKGRQALFVGAQQYIMAYLESFEHKFFQDAFGFRYADWVLKFFADDPRYLSPTPTTTTHSNTAASGVSTNTLPLTTTGNVRTYPVLTFTAGAATVGAGPYVEITYGGLTLGVKFSMLTMVAGSTLVITCDPRPNTRSIAAVYTAGGPATNALQYCAITDFSNDYDLTEWFPFIDPGIIQTLSYGFAAGSGGAYTFSTTVTDRWL